MHTGRISPLLGIYAVVFGCLMLGAFFISYTLFGPPNFFHFYLSRVFGTIAFVAGFLATLVLFTHALGSLREDATSMNPMLWTVVGMLSLVVALLGLYVLLSVFSCPKGKGMTECNTIFVQFKDDVEGQKAIEFIENIGLRVDEEVKTKFLNTSLVEAEIYFDISPGTSQEKLNNYREIVARLEDNANVRDCVSYEEDLDEDLKGFPGYEKGNVDCTFENNVTITKAKEILGQLQIDPRGSDFYQLRGALVVKVPPGTAEKWAESIRKYTTVVETSRRGSFNINDYKILDQ